MHDIKFIRDHPEAFDRGLIRRGLPPASAEILRLDQAKRDHLQRLQDAQARRNAVSKEVGEAMKAGDKARAEELKKEVASLKDFIASGEETERTLNKQIADALAVIPNLPLDDVPDGKDEHDNKEIRRWSTPPQFTFAPRQHFEIGEALGLMDFETASKLSGARFVILRGQLARLERALAQFMLALQTKENGYEEIYAPYMLRDEAMFGVGQLPKFEDDLFSVRSGPGEESVFDWIRIASEKVQSLANNGELSLDKIQGIFDLHSNNLESAKKRHRYWLIPTAEASLTNLVRERILTESELPIRLTAYTPCFRAEAGAAGKDTRGMIRQHQFSKVELVSVTTPEQAVAEHERMTECAEEVLKRLNLHYRTITLCTGDMGFGSRKTYDIEVWLPGQNTFREISSCSQFGEFQARRMEARYRPEDGKGTRYVHTLNGSGLAVGRTIVAILENYQNADGSVTIPEALRPFMDGQERIAKTDEE